MRKLSVVFTLTMVMVFTLSTITIVPHNTSATLPTITKYGVNPTVSDAGNTLTFFLTYTDADNDSPLTGYPKAWKFLAHTWPSFAFIANDTGDTNYADGKAYYYVWTWFPVVGVNMWYFGVKSGLDAVVQKLVTNTVMMPSKLAPFAVYPACNYAGTFLFTFNYTSPWGYLAKGVNLTMDGISYPMIENNTLDTITWNGKMFHLNLTLNASTHHFEITWYDSAYSVEIRTTGEHWMILTEEPDYNKWIFAVVLIMMIMSVAFVAFIRKK